MDEDVKNLYAPRFSRNVRVTEQTVDGSLQLTYVVEGKPILTDIRLVGNKQYSRSRLMKKVTSKVGEPLDERRLFTDAQEIQNYYEKAGYQKTKVKALAALNQTRPPDRGTVTIEITEAPKIHIKDIIFDK